MTKKTKRNIAKTLIFTYHTLNFLAVAMFVLFLIWIAFSFIEVQIHNWTMLSDNPYKYSGINFFGKMMEWFPCR